MITKIKIFNEHDAHHLLKLGLKCFYAHQSEMSLMSVNLFQTTRLK